MIENLLFLVALGYGLYALLKFLAGSNSVDEQRIEDLEREVAELREQEEERN